MRELLEELRSNPRRDLKGVIVLLNGSIASETYFNGAGADTLHDVRSVGKSITSLLVGIALNKGLIRSVDESVFGLLTGVRDTARAKITLEDVLTMRSGLAANDDDPNSPGNESRLDASTDWLAFTSTVPVQGPPGGRFTYASLNAFLAGAVVERVSGKTLSDFAAENLFGPWEFPSSAGGEGRKGRAVGRATYRYA